jgi:hypothetical protein
VTDEMPIGLADADDEKYITFNREEFMQWLGEMSTYDLREMSVAEILSKLENLSLADAVVIRRQDYFASPALAGYAASIGVTLHMVEDPKTRAQLMAVADYFQRQSELAADEGWKLPDL